MSRPRIIKFLDGSRSDPIIIRQPSEPSETRVDTSSQSILLEGDSRRWSGVPIWRRFLKSQQSSRVNPLPQSPIISPPSTVRRKPVPIYIEERVPEAREQREHPVTVIPLTDHSDHHESYAPRREQGTIVISMPHTRPPSVSEYLSGRRHSRDFSRTISSEVRICLVLLSRL
jgi:hypothetical protein